MEKVSVEYRSTLWKHLLHFGIMEIEKLKCRHKLMYCKQDDDTLIWFQPVVYDALGVRHGTQRQYNVVLIAVSAETIADRIWPSREASMLKSDVLFLMCMKPSLFGDEMPADVTINELMITTNNGRFLLKDGVFSSFPNDESHRTYVLYPCDGIATVIAFNNRTLICTQHNAYIIPVQSQYHAHLDISLGRCSAIAKPLYYNCDNTAYLSRVPDVLILKKRFSSIVMSWGWMHEVMRALHKALRGEEVETVYVHVSTTYMSTHVSKKCYVFTASVVDASDRANLMCHDLLMTHVAAPINKSAGKEVLVFYNTGIDDDDLKDQLVRALKRNTVLLQGLIRLAPELKDLPLKNRQ